MRPSGLTSHALVRHEFAQTFAQRAKALGCAVLQHGAGVVGQNSGGGFGDAFHVKQRRVRKAARKADDAGFAQQFEEFADGGGFYVLRRSANCMVWLCECCEWDYL